MSNFIDSRVPDFLLAPRFKFARHFLLLLTLFCITISIFVNQSGELVLTLERFCGWLYYFVITSTIIYFNLYILPVSISVFPRNFGAAALAYDFGMNYNTW